MTKKELQYMPMVSQKAEIPPKKTPQMVRDEYVKFMEDMTAAAFTLLGFMACFLIWFAR